MLLEITYGEVVHKDLQTINMLHMLLWLNVLSLLAFSTKYIASSPGHPTFSMFLHVTLKTWEGLGTRLKIYTHTVKIEDYILF